MVYIMENLSLWLTYSEIFFCLLIFGFVVKFEQMSREKCVVKNLLCWELTPYIAPDLFNLVKILILICPCIFDGNNLSNNMGRKFCLVLASIHTELGISLPIRYSLFNLTKYHLKNLGAWIHRHNNEFLKFNFQEHGFRNCHFRNFFYKAF